MSDYFGQAVILARMARMQKWIKQRGFIDACKSCSGTGKSADGTVCPGCAAMRKLLSFLSSLTERGLSNLTEHGAAKVKAWKDAP